MPVLLLVLFVIVPIAELYVIVQIAGEIGILPTLALLVLDSVAGTLLMKSQGRAAWKRFNEATAEGRIPAREVADGALIILGGAFLLTPGFLTDIAGLVLLIPPTRALVRRVLSGMVKGRVAMGPRAAHWGYTRMRSRRTGPRPAPGWPPPGPPPTGGSRPGDIEGTAQEIRDEDELERGEPER
jgi:UPF0716 protein FxsA